MAVDISNISKQKKQKQKKASQNGLWDFLNKDIQLGGGKISDAKKEKFYSELSILLNSGIDLSSSLEIIIEEENKKKLQEVFTAIRDDLIHGRSFSEAVKNAKLFSDYEYYSIRVGEESGNLEKILLELASYFKNRVAQKRLLSGALTYPIMVLVVAFGAVGFMLNVIVPMFAGVFKRFGGDLPALTKRIMQVSKFFSDYFGLLLLFLVALVVGIIFLRKYEFYKKISSRITLKIPVMGKLIQKIFLSRLCNTVSLLITSGSPLIDALDLAEKTIKFYPVHTAVAKLKANLYKGQSLHESMKQHKIFDKRLISLTKVGEETNKLDYLYRKLHEQYDEEIKHSTEQLGNLLEPLLIIFVGALVMVVLIAMYLPLFQLSTTIL